MSWTATPAGSAPQASSPAAHAAARHPSPVALALALAPRADYQRLQTSWPVFTVLPRSHENELEEPSWLMPLQNTPKLYEKPPRLNTPPAEPSALNTEPP